MPYYPQHPVDEGYEDSENELSSNPYSPGTGNWSQYENSRDQDQLKARHGQQASLWRSF
jgi:hypothetical protein